MTVELNHTIVHARDKHASAAFLAGLLDLEAVAADPFVMVRLSNGVALDYATVPAEQITPQHYAFLVSDEVFDTAYARIRERGVTHHADPHGRLPNAVNHHDGGRGVYFVDPSGHVMEILTVPYGGWPTVADG